MNIPRLLGLHSEAHANSVKADEFDGIGETKLTAFCLGLFRNILISQGGGFQSTVKL